ncbi:nucleotidyltransferase family protein [Shewanella youngdeokensis]|uniref:Nucleotidyltransferase family protein n=1 Tax=Shewanella youngdeokensis TaxID=2999068 RepID=A0ABZ0JX94_9GAMM|nr:nucleotidyltransferase family protein [Shewanella sp. DAU334]
MSHPTYQYEPQRMLTPEQQIIQWLEQDDYRYQALIIAEQLQLPQWMLAAGFVRNLVWDKLHGYSPTPLNDIDLIYFDPSNLTAEQDERYQAKLMAIAPDYAWSVKNQARMHLKNQHAAYQSSYDAMRYWPEKETAVAVNINGCGLKLLAPFGCERLFQLTLSHNNRAAAAIFEQRISSKKWLTRYPQLYITA